MPLHLSHEAAGNLAIVRATDIISRAEADTAKKDIINIIRRYGKVNILIIIEKDFANLDMFANWDDDEDDEFIQKHIIRMAILGDIKWKDRALLFFLKGFLRFSMEFFKLEQEALARAWLLHP